MKNLSEVLETYRAVAIFLSLVLLVTTIFVSICYASRAVFRQAANDPQIEVTEQVAKIIEQGVPLEAIISSAEVVELNDSKALFVVIYDGEKNLVASSATLDGQSLSIPAEQVALASGQDTHRFDWQPKDELKFALVSKKVGDSAYIVAGRSLAETTLRMESLRPILFGGWIVSILFSLLITFLIRPQRSLAIIEETNVTLVENSAEVKE